MMIKPDLAVPTLVVSGEIDRLFTAKEQRKLAAAFKSELIIIPNIAHDMMLDTNWKMAAKVIQNWLEQSV